MNFFLHYLKFLFSIARNYCIKYRIYCIAYVSSSFRKLKHSNLLGSYVLDILSTPKLNLKVFLLIICHVLGHYRYLQICGCGTLS